MTLVPRRRRYTLTPARLRWNHFNLTYRYHWGPGRRAGGQANPDTASDISSRYPTPRILSFPRNLLNPEETRKGLAAAFRMWSEVSPFRFREVAPEHPSDLQIGGWVTEALRPRPPQV